MLAFLKNYPLRYYAKTFTGRTSQTKGVIYLRDRETAGMLVRKGNAPSSFIPDVHQYAGAPLPYVEVQPESPFGTQVLERFDATLGGAFAFMVDGPDYELRLISSASLGVTTVEDLRALPLKTVLPAYQSTEPLIWDFLNPDGTPLGESLPASLLFVGMPVRIRDWAEQWCETMNGTLIGIEPAILSILRWCQSHANGFILIPSLQESLLAVVQNQTLVLLERQPGTAALLQAPDKIRFDDLARDLGMAERKISVYPKGLSPLKAKELLKAIGPEARLVEAPEGSPEIRCTDGPLPVDAHVMALQVENPLELFLSDNHQKYQLYRTNRFFRGTFHLLIFFGIFQVIGIGCWFYRDQARRSLAAMTQSIENESKRLDEETEKLAPLLRRIESVAEWRPVLARKQRVGVILAGIESAVPPEVCLQRITLLNHERNPKAPDRPSVSVVGWRKEGFDLEKGFLDQLRTVFPQFTVTLRTSNGDDALFTLDISQ